MYAKSILVFPSHIETLGLPLLEARAAGCRIVASDIAAAREALLSIILFTIWPRDRPRISPGECVRRGLRVGLGLRDHPPPKLLRRRWAPLGEGWLRRLTS